MTAPAPAVNLDAYFRRIGYAGSRSPSLDTLRGIHFQHPLAIPFENLNPLMGWPVQLDRPSLEQKIIGRRRGGYCYEQNLLFRHVLEAIGFQVTGLAARVTWNVPEGTTLPRTHMLLRVEAGGESYICDVGFGGLTLTAPLRLAVDVEQSTPHESFRFIREGEEWVMQALLRESWKSLYRFTLEPQVLADYEMANWYVSCHPQSRFVNFLIAARAATDRRHALLNTEYAVHYRTGETERAVLTSPAEIRDVLGDAMGIALPETADLEPALRRILGIKA